MNSSENPQLILETVEECSKRFVNDISLIESSDWEIPSKCHQWAIKDIYSHTLAINGFFLNSISSAIQGDGTPSEVMPNPGTGNARSMAEGIASRAIQISETAFPTISQLVDTVKSMESNLITLFQNIESANWHSLAYHPAGKFSPYLLLKMKLMELVIHYWDIFSPLDPMYQIPEKEAKLLCEICKDPNITNWFYTQDEKQIEPITLDFCFEDQQGLRIQTWRGSLNIFDRPLSKNTDEITTIETTYRDFALLITARKNIYEAADSNLIAVSGDKSKISDFHNWFRGS